MLKSLAKAENLQWTAQFRRAKHCAHPPLTGHPPSVHMPPSPCSHATLPLFTCHNRFNVQLRCVLSRRSPASPCSHATLPLLTCPQQIQCPAPLCTFTPLAWRPQALESVVLSWSARCLSTWATLTMQTPASSPLLWPAPTSSAAPAALAAPPTTSALSL